MAGNRRTEYQLTQSGRGASIRGTSTAPRGPSSNNARTMNTSRTAPAVHKATAAPSLNADFMAQATARFETVRPSPLHTY
jgi:hypothetical protein